MKMKRCLAALLAVAALPVLLSGCSDRKEQSGTLPDTNLPGVSEQMNGADYWISKLKDADSEMLSAADITKLNQQITGGDGLGVVDLVTYPSQLTDEQLRGYIGAFAVPTGDLYAADGTKYETEYYDGLVTALNYDAILSSNKVSYAIAMSNVNLRRFPTADPAFTDASSKAEDAFQEAVLPVGEPMIVLHNSGDQQWFFVQTRTMRGWVPAASVVLMEKGTWASYIGTDKFLVVTAPSITLEPDPYSSLASGITLYMGTRLPLYNEADIPDTVDEQSAAGCYIVKYPSRDRYGYLDFTPVLIPKSADASVGYLPYTQENVLKQAFKMLGKRYLPGGLYGGRDNAGFISDLYRVFGIYMPATTAAQAAVPSSNTDLSELSTSEREKALKKLTPATLLFSEKQGFLFLGMDGGKPYVLHPATDFYINDKHYTVNSTVISGLDVVQEDGTAFLDALTVAVKPALVKSDGKSDSASSGAGKSGSASPSAGQSGADKSSTSGAK